MINIDYVHNYILVTSSVGYIHVHVHIHTD